MRLHREPNVDRDKVEKNSLHTVPVSLKGPPSFVFPAFWEASTKTSLLCSGDLCTCVFTLEIISGQLYTLVIVMY